MKRLRSAGFTLLELSIVLVIIAIITAVGFAAGRGMVETSRRVATDNKLDVIEKALMQFRVKNNRLPCPGNALKLEGDANYGIEAATPGTCYSTNPAVLSATRQAIINYVPLPAVPNVTYNYTYENNPYNLNPTELSKPTIEGTVPVRTLGLPDDFMYDGWGRKFAYGVDAQATAVDAFSNILPDDKTCNITIQDATGTGNKRSGGAIYALVSYGENGWGGYLQDGTQLIGNGGYNTNEQINLGLVGYASQYRGNYLQQEIEGNPDDVSYGFDDIVRYKERWQLTTEEELKKEWYKGPKIMSRDGWAGTWDPSTGSTWNRNLDRINKCGVLIYRHQKIFPLLNLADSYALLFTPDNKQYIDLSSGWGCKLFNMFPDGSYSEIPGAFTSCPQKAIVSPPVYNVGNPTVLSDNGYLVTAATSTSAGANGELQPPFIYIFKKTGNSVTQIPLALLQADYPTAIPKQLSISNNAEYFLALRSGTYSEAVLYKRTGDSFTKVPASVWSGYVSDGTSTQHWLGAALSPDAKMIVKAGEDGIIHSWIWSNATTPPVFVEQPTLNYSGHPINITAIAFSPDGKYFVTIGTSADSSGIILSLFNVAENGVITNLSNSAFPFHYGLNTLAENLNSITSLVVSRDAKSVYVSSSLGDSITSATLVYNQQKNFTYSSNALYNTYPFSSRQPAIPHD